MVKIRLSPAALKQGVKERLQKLRMWTAAFLRSKRNRLLLIPLGLLLFGALFILSINVLVQSFGRRYTCYIGDAPPAQAVIVLGAYVDQRGEPCGMLYDRIATGVDIYSKGKVKKILMSGDHSLVDYDEVNNMRRYAHSWGVPPQDIFMDHAGFCTYDSMYRARDIFKVRSAIVVTQEFHLSRAVYIARKLGIEAVGVKADRREYDVSEMIRLRNREFLACQKAFLMVNVTKPPPFFLGPAIPIDGDGRATYDDK